jgi:hypothetical protein
MERGGYVRMCAREGELMLILAVYPSTRFISLMNPLWWP